ncbi:MAG TPA: hypothetical protein VJL83_05000 [Patescibacteria group bacterium]|nr:hypothetical protein [Patescibacteria group bacterium]
MTQERKLTELDRARFRNGINLSDGELEVIQSHLNKHHGQMWIWGMNPQLLVSNSDATLEEYWKHCRAVHDGERSLEKLME